MHHVQTNNFIININQFYQKYYFSTKSDCINGWGKLVLLFYNLKLYDSCKNIVNYCLEKCTPDMIYLNVQPHINIPQKHMQSLLSSEKYFSRIVQHFGVSCVRFLSPSLLTNELKHIFKSKLCDEGTVLIPHVVFILFMDFLCNMHLKDDEAMIDAFTKLLMTVQKEYFIMTDIQKETSEQILLLAFSMMDMN